MVLNCRLINNSLGETPKNNGVVRLLNNPKYGSLDFSILIFNVWMALSATEFPQGYFG